ncbi:MAG: S-layer homology domain-containing protein [Oscillospiraceae bacterium]|nr:S-layer homology domain-containing protein [Oscillospiraceae bacterium]
MKKAITMLLVLSLTLGLLALPAGAEENADAVRMVRALGILVGDEAGDLNLDSHVTRAEFSKMLTAASPYKDAVGGAGGYSLFKDVKQDHWAVEYIKVSVEQGWFMGYMDGTFRPNQTITLEEAATVSLRLLGYTAADLAGSYPAAQLSKFNALGLHTGFSAAQGQKMTRRDCAHLFYNLMAAQTKAGMVYAQSLGYQLDSTGHVDYASLVQSNTKGPFTLKSGGIADSLPFSAQGATVYRGGAAASLSDARPYDVYYYNQNLRTVWIYSNRVTGTYTAAAPSATAPSTVTVAGIQYPIETSGAAYQLSTQGSFQVGDTVTLLLGMNGGVADVCAAEEAASVFYGVVREAKNQTVTAADGSVTASKAVRILCTDGVERTFDAAAGSYTAGTVVQVDYSAKTPVIRLSGQKLSGKVNAAGTRLGDYTLAAGVEILDTDQYGNAVRVFPRRLAGVSLASQNVLFAARNAQDEITHLILRDATADTASYGYITAAQELAMGDQLMSSYTCLMQGQEVPLGGSGVLYGASAGGAMIVYRDGKLETLRNLSSVKLTSLTATTASASGRQYTISEAAQVYIKKGSDYFLTTVTAVSGGDYTLTGWYDSFGHPAGGLIRVLIAESK